VTALCTWLFIRTGVDDCMLLELKTVTAVMGFCVVSVTFILCAMFYHDLSKHENVGYFQVLYYLSTFFGQVGLVL
jgi:hypothetical protein